MRKKRVDTRLHDSAPPFSTPSSTTSLASACCVEHNAPFYKEATPHATKHPPYALRRSISTTSRLPFRRGQRDSGHSSHVVHYKLHSLHPRTLRNIQTTHSVATQPSLWTLVDITLGIKYVLYFFVTMDSCIQMQVESQTISLRIPPLGPTDTHVAYFLTVTKSNGETVTQTGSLPLSSSETLEPSTDPVVQHFYNLFQQIDDSRYITQRAQHIMELHRFAFEDGLRFLQTPSRLRDIIHRRCQDYYTKARQYQSVVEELCHLLLLVNQVSATTTATATPTACDAPTMETLRSVEENEWTYDPESHHC